MALDDDIRTLGETPLFDQLGRDALRLVAFSADRVRLAGGEVLFREGDAADSAFVVASGALTLQRGGSKKRVGPGALVGEIALICDTARPATATAEGVTEALRIQRTLFTRLFDEYPDLARRLHARLSARLEANVAELRSVEALLRK